MRHLQAGATPSRPDPPGPDRPGGRSERLRRGSTTPGERQVKREEPRARRQLLRRAAHRTGHGRRHPAVVSRRGQEAGDHQLPDPAPREGRPVLRADLRTVAGLGVLLRQVQAGEVQGHHLRALRRRGDPCEGSTRADGPHRARRPGDPHLVLQGCPEPARLPAGPGAEGPREGHLLRRLHDHECRRREAAPGSAEPRGPDRRGAPAADLASRRRPRRPGQEARDRPRPARGRGRQVRRPPEGPRRWRARAAPAPRPRPARAGPPRRRLGPVQEARGLRPRGRRDAVPRAPRPVR